MADSGDLIGKTIGKCRILGRLGHGKTSRVYRAFYEPLNKEVAVKILKEDMKASEEIRGKFISEARALARLDHQNIVKVFDVVEVKGHLFIIMELLKGRDLWEILKEDGPFDPEKAVDAVIQAARALKAAHDQNIVHRDVKPQNIMLVGRRQQVKLLDFGLAGEGAVAGTAGTPHYMSPEQIQGKRVDEKSDIYSLGATFFHMLAGKPPFPGESRQEILDKHLEGKIPSPSRANRENPSPQALDPIVKRMMAPVPGYRFSAQDLAETLEEANLGAASRAKMAHKARVVASTRKGPPVGLLVGAVAVLAIVALLVVVLLVKEKKGPIGPGPDIGNQGGPIVKPEVGIVGRADARLERERMAEGMFQRAKDFESAHFDAYATIIEKYKELWDQYGDTAWGQKAKDQIQAAEGRRDADKINNEKVAKARKAREALEKLDTLLGTKLAVYDHAGARKAIEEYMLEHGEAKEMMERYNRLEYAAKFLALLAQEITDNPKKYSLNLFQESAPEEAKVESASVEKGLLIKEGSLENWRAWDTLKAPEISRIAQRQLGTRNAMNFFLLYNFLLIAGEKEEAAEWFQQAKATDEFGVIEEMEKQIKGK